MVESWQRKLTPLSQKLYTVLDHPRNATLLPIVAHQLLERDTEDIRARGHRQRDALLVLRIFSAIGDIRGALLRGREKCTDKRREECRFVLAVHDVPNPTV